MLHFQIIFEVRFGVILPPTTMKSNRLPFVGTWGRIRLFRCEMSSLDRMMLSKIVMNNRYWDPEQAWVTLGPKNEVGIFIVWRLQKEE